MALNIDRGRREQAAHDHWLSRAISIEHHTYLEQRWRRSLRRWAARLVDSLEAATWGRR